MHFTPPSVLPMTRTLVLALSLGMVWPVAMAQTAISPATATSTPSAVASPTQTVLARGPAGTIITVVDVLSEVQRAPEANRQAILTKPEAVQQIVNNLLVRRALAHEATRDGLDKDPLVAASLEIVRDRALSDVRLARLDAQNTPAEAALDAYARNMYKANVDKFEMPAQTRARHILLANTGPDALAKAKTLLAQLRAGANFEELAKANSTDASNAARGGDLGFFSAGKMVRPFEDAVNALAKPGDLSEPVETQFGYHIIRLEERRDKGTQPYDEVKPMLMNEARTALLNESRVQKVQSLSKDMVIDRAAIEAFIKSGER